MQLRKSIAYLKRSYSHSYFSFLFPITLYRHGNPSIIIKLNGLKWKRESISQSGEREGITALPQFDNGRYTNTADRNKLDTSCGLQGMTGKGWTWLGTDGSTSSTFESSPNLQRHMQGMVGTRPKKGEGRIYRNLLTTWAEKDANTFPGLVHSSRSMQVWCKFSCQESENTKCSYSKHTYLLIAACEVGLTDPKLTNHSTRSHSAI